MSLVPINPGWSGTKKLYLLQYKKIIIRSNKRMFSSALPPLLYTRAIFYLFYIEVEKRLPCRVKSDNFGPVGFSAPLSVLWALCVCRMITKAMAKQL